MSSTLIITDLGNFESTHTFSTVCRYIESADGGPVKFDGVDGRFKLYGAKVMAVIETKRDGEESVPDENESGDYEGTEEV